MAIEYPDDNALMIPELIPNRDLIELRKTFGIDPQFLLSDSNQYYTNINDNAPIEKIDDGIASIDTGLPMYIPDGDNNFLQYSDEGAPAYIRDREPAAPINSFLKGPEFYQNNAMTEKEYADRISKIREYNKNLDSSYTDEELREIINLQNQKKPEKTGILQNIKDGGSKLLDFIKSGGITGNLIKGILPEQNPDATFLRDYYGGEDGSNIKDGTIQSGLMAGYNPISGGLFGKPVTYGLQNAYDRRIKAIQNTIQKKYLDKGKSLGDTKLDERLEKLREEKRKEAEALLQSQLATAQQEIASQGYKDYGQGGASASEMASYEGSDGSYAGASTQDYGGGE